MPKKTVEIIRASGNDYLIQVKGNQKGLLEHTKNIVTYNKPLDSYKTSEKSRGRQENRYYAIYPLNSVIYKGWESVRTIIHVHRYGNRPDKKTQGGNYSEHHYYISSCLFHNAQQAARGIRGHWGIENKIHFVKDTHYYEDDNGIRHNKAAAILSIFQDMAINIYRCLGFHSLKTATIFYANKVNELFRFLSAYSINEI